MPVIFKGPFHDLLKNKGLANRGDQFDCVDAMEPGAGNDVTQQLGWLQSDRLTELLKPAAVPFFF